MIGMPENPPLVTELWRTQLAFLSEIAQKNRVGMMLWGDQALGPGEAIDAALGDTTADAAARRDAIPKGATIADWHYKADPNPQGFQASLRLWKRAGMRPIASAWYQPDNVRGFYQAALLERTGTLQTTWTGYESNEENMMRNFAQFSAMILAGDYAWSGRSEMPGALGYDPAEVFRRMYFDPPSPLSPRKGLLLAEGEAKATRVGSVAFALSPGLGLASRVLPPDPSRGSEATVETDASGTELAIALDSAVRLADGEPVGKLVVTMSDGRTIERRLIYGRQIRAEDDPGAIVTGERERGISVLRIPLGSKAARVRRVSLLPLGPVAGPRLRGLTLLQ